MSGNVYVTSIAWMVVREDTIVTMGLLDDDVLASLLVSILGLAWPD